MDPSDATGDNVSAPVYTYATPLMDPSDTTGDNVSAPVYTCADSRGSWHNMPGVTSLKEAEQLHKKLEVRVKRSKQPTNLSSESSSKKRFSNVDSGGGDLYRVVVGSVELCSVVFVEGKLWNEPIDLLIDTGAAVSLINEKVWRRVSNDKLQSTNRCDVLLSKGIMRVGEGEVPLNQTLEEPQPRVRRVTLKETIVIPSGHEVVLQAAGSADMEMGVLETNSHLSEKHGVFAARVLVSSKDKAIPVRLLNPHPQPVTLYSGTHIGSLMPCVMAGTVGTGDKTTRGEKASSLFDLDSAMLSPTQRSIAEAMFVSCKSGTEMEDYMFREIADMHLVGGCNGCDRFVSCKSETEMEDYMFREIADIHLVCGCNGAFLQ
uniref:Peptidase A2 domain-containing protein n=1 Tax=Timema tahoe TaxID=61484 RepID=A0A7R9NYQ4_9NEOP|nr:unnamed protein product [Timema tahoe]